MSRRWVLVASSILAALVVSAAFFGSSGLRHYRRLVAEAETLTTQNHQLSEENSTLREEIRRLKDDQAYLEKVARDQLGHVRPGDSVYLVAPDGARTE
ncbi:MAG: septum formation initiator family protein [Pseudomonadota bacterium]